MVLWMLVCSLADHEVYGGAYSNVWFICSAAPTGTNCTTSLERGMLVCPLPVTVVLAAHDIVPFTLMTYTY